jgi:hypothetical protein
MGCSLCRLHFRSWNCHHFPPQGRMAYQSNRCQLCWKFECSHNVCSAACCFSCFRYIYRMRLSRGLGGLIWVPMTSFWGRAPVLFWTAVIGMLFGIGAAVSKDFSTFHAMRACTGLFITAAQTISIAFIKGRIFLLRTSSQDWTLGMFVHCLAVHRTLLRKLRGCRMETGKPCSGCALVSVLSRSVLSSFLSTNRTVPQDMQPALGRGNLSRPSSLARGP